MKILAIVLTLAALTLLPACSASTTPVGIPSPASTTRQEIPSPASTSTSQSPAVSDVSDFGAVGDGVADDTAAIQAAIDHASALGGGVVFLPAGEYRTTAELRITSGKLTLSGVGPDSVIHVTSPSKPEVGIHIEGESTITDLEIRDLALIGNYDKWDQKGIDINGLSNAHFENIAISDFGFCGVFAFNSSNVTLANLDVKHIGDFGIQFKEGSRDVTVSDCKLTGFASRQYPGHAIYFEDVLNAVAERNQISAIPSGIGNEISGIKYSASSGRCVDNIIQDVFGGISTPGAHDVLVEGNTIRHATERGIYILAGANNIVVKNNTLDDTLRGIQFNSYDVWPTNVHLLNNVVLSGGTVDLFGGPSSMIVEMSGNSWQQGAAKQ